MVLPCGSRFGRLTVIEQRQKYSHLCECECGSRVVVKTADLKRGHTRSCGCLHADGIRETFTTHGMAGSPEHNIWNLMRRRCLNPDSKDYRHYGGRGILCCDRWAASFSAFVGDMGLRPSPNHTLDRIDNNGHYEPGNCRWSTRKEQALNRRACRLLTARGTTLPVSLWAERRGMRPGTLFARLNKGWTVENSLFTPVGRTAEGNHADAR
jgi:hypothetical protein